MTPEPLDEPATEAALAMHVDLALSPFGDAHHLAEHDRSVRWLLQNAAVAYPYVLQLAARHRSSSLLELLATFDREESTPIFAAALRSGTEAAAEAGIALGRARDFSAGTALVEALALANAATVIAALDGLRLRRDPATCAGVVAHIESQDPRVRYAAVHAASGIGCIDRQRLKTLAKSDSDADVRSLSARLARSR